MLYTPKHCDFVVETVTTANKNIQSFFMRTDLSYHVPESQRHPQYGSKFSPLILFVDNNQIVIEYNSAALDHSKEAEEDAAPAHGSSEKEDAVIRHTISCDSIQDCSYNAENHQAFERCSNKIYKAIYIILNGKISFRDYAVQLIFCDFLPRSELISLVDIVLNKLGFREIMLLPTSLAMSFSLVQSHGVFIFKHGISFIDDFMLFDSFKITKLGESVVGTMEKECPVDNVDFVEEFSRLKFIDEALCYSCDQCEYKESVEEKMVQHINKEHPLGTYFLYTQGRTLLEAYNNRIRYLFNKEKRQKIQSHICFVEGAGVEELREKISHAEVSSAEQPSDENRKIDAPHITTEIINKPASLAIKGAMLFNQLSCSKECWLTDKEWQAYRLRSLKEKLLFFI